MERIIEIIKRLFGVAKKIIPSVDVAESYYEEYILKWGQIYKGFYEPWHKVTTTIGERQLASMQVAKLICSEMSSLVFTENIEINIDNKAIDTYIKDVFKENGFSTNQSELIEYMFALGGAINKVRRENDKTIIDFVNADSFIPTKWTNTRITEGMFITNTTKGAYIYTLAETHTMVDNSAVVEYTLYKKLEKNNSSVGNVVPLGELYPELEAITTDDKMIIVNSGTPIFSYFKPQIGNNMDMNTPLGISLFGNSLDTIHSLDIAFDSFQREFVLGRKRITVPAHALKPVTDPVTGTVARYFDPNIDVYEGINIDERDQVIEDNTQTLRIEEHVAAINALLNILCIQVGVTPGFVSFDASSGLKTATEVISENSKTYRTKVKQEKSIKKNIEELIQMIVAVGEMHKDIQSAEYTVEIKFDDSIVEDKAAERLRDQNEVLMGTMKKWEYRMKWYAETMEEAKASAKELSKGSIEEE